MKNGIKLLISVIMFMFAGTIMSAADLTVHFKKPTTYTNAYIYYWNTSPAVAAVTWPGKAMTAETNGWYKYTITGAASASIIFNNKGTPQTANLTRNKEGWYKDGAWYDTNPENTTVVPFKVHFKKPSTYANAYIYYWNTSPALTVPAWPGTAMTAEGNDWYVFTINANSSSIIFNNKGTPQTADLSRSKEGWFMNNIWYDSNPEDSVAPTAALTAPTTGTKTGTITVSATASDNVGVAKVAFYYGTTLIAEDTTSPYSVSWDTTTAANATYALKAVAYDAAGLTGTSATVSVTVSNSVDTTAPTVTLTAPIASTVTGTVTASANATDNVGVTKVIFYYGSTVIGEDTTAPYSISWNTTTAANGTNAVKAEAYDAKNNKGTSLNVNVTVNNPVTGLVVHYKNSSNWATPYIYFWATTPAVTLPAWPGVAMVNEGNGYYKYTITGVTSSNIIFSNKGVGQTADLTRNKEGWYADGVWLDEDPNGPVPTASPEGKDFWEDTIAITLGFTNATTAKYTLDGTDPLNGTTYANTTIVNIGSGMAIGATKTLRLYATNGTKVTTKTLTYKKIAKPVTPSFVWNNANVYFVIQDRFLNGNTSNDTPYGRVKVDATGKNIGTFHGGDLKGMTTKVNDGYFTNLGTNAIWITAPYEQIHGWCGGGSTGDFAHYAYHGYYTLDYTTLDKNMGTVAELREFVDAAHAKGIRVIFDIVMNHAGYENLKDMFEYNFGKVNGIIDTWTPGSGQNWHSHNNYIDKTDATAWGRWWGSWVRKDFAGYTQPGGDDLTKCLDFLPDYKTEMTSSVGMAPILQTKWSKETTGFTDWINPAAAAHRKDLGIAPRDYQILWLSDWVREFGIDGFRVDTAKHVEQGVWKLLKEKCTIALADWKAANPTKKVDNLPFWMTGEAWGHGPDRSNYYDNGFDSMINFSYVGAAKNAISNYSAIDGTYSSYASSSASPLSYISSHDTGLFSQSYSDATSQKKVGAILLLTPKPVQVFYGDENGRPFGATGSDQYQGTRSDYVWGDKADVLAHWQKIGQFRNKHVAVGAGTHVKLADSPYTFARVKDTDKVVCVLGASGSTTVSVSSVFANGTVLKDYYTGTTATVANGTVTFAANANGVILIEAQ